MSDRSHTVTSSTALGDPLPKPLMAYLAAIDDGRFTDAAAPFGDHGLYAVALPGGIETEPRTETVGRRPLEARFEERGAKPWRHEVVLCATEGRDVLLEGVLVADTREPVATFVASATLGSEDQLDRYLAFSCDGARDPVPTDVPADDEPAAALAVLHRYFDALDAGRFTDAAACFSTDVLYSHPPYKHTGIDGSDRIEFRGRDELLAAFEARGRASFDHDIVACIQRGPHCLLEGVVRGLPDDGTGSFISSLSLAGDGTIRRYVSFYCEPGVRRVA